MMARDREVNSYHPESSRNSKSKTVTKWEDFWEELEKGRAQPCRNIGVVRDQRARG